MKQVFHSRLINIMSSEIVPVSEMHHSLSFHYLHSMTARPKLKLFDFTMIVISLVIGMGIFRTPVNVAREAPSTFVFFAAWVAGGLVALCGALTYAEIGSRLPVTGGYYKIFSYAYHPSIAFGVNCLILVSNAASLAGVALIGGEYITGVFVPALKDPAYMQVAANAAHIHTVQMMIALAAIALFYGVNLLGLKMSARTQSVLMVIKIILIFLLIAPLFFSTGNAMPTTLVASLHPGLHQYIKAFGIGLVAVSFTYGGYQQTINFGGEVERKNISRGIFLGIFTIIVLYLTINYAYIKVIGFENLKHSTNIAAIMAGKIFGANAERVLSTFLFLSVLAYVNVLLMSNPRVMFAMSEDRILPPAFQKRNDKTGALVISLTVFATLCALIVFWAEEFDTILSFSIFLDCFGMILSAGSIFILRKKTAHLNRTGIFQMKLYPLLPVLFILAYVFVATSLLINETKLSLIGIGVLTGFVVLYFLFPTEIQLKMPEPHRHRHHSHSRKPRRKLRAVDIILLLWSSISLVSFLFLLDRVETAPVWQVAFLTASTLIGIIVFFSLVFRTKK